MSRVTFNYFIIIIIPHPYKSNINFREKRKFLFESDNNYVPIRENYYSGVRKINYSRVRIIIWD